MISFLNKLFGRGSPQGPQAGEIVVAAFGKHPGWDDHFELGIDSDCLAHVRQAIYVDGIAGNVDSGIWDRLPADRRLERFNHILLWRAPENRRSNSCGVGGETVIAARLWSSRDAKGRDRYPMALAAQCVGWPVGQVADIVLPILARGCDTAQRVATADEVIQLLQQGHHDIASAMATIQPSSVAPTPPALDEKPLLNLIYHLERNAAAHPAIHFRVQRAAESIAGSCSGWEHFFRFVCSCVARQFLSEPILCLQALDGSEPMPWLDVIVGRPQRDDLFCIRANTAALPLTTDIPYNLDPEFIVGARQILAAMQPGK